jgi:hypothetical protein
MNRFCVSRLGWLLEASLEAAVLARACTGWLAAGLGLALAGADRLMGWLARLAGQLGRPKCFISGPSRVEL